MSPSKGAIKFARGIFEEMFQRAATVDDGDHLVILAIAFDATEKAARAQYEQGIAEEREACAVVAATTSIGCTIGCRIAYNIRARAKS